MPSPNILRQTANWKELLFYRKSDALFQLTFAFCQNFLPQHGDRTVDQMVQAARSGKQNIIEGSEAGMTSTETELKLLNVARASLQELREDYRDYLNSRGLLLWDTGHPRYSAMLSFCHSHNDASDYLPIVNKMGDEEFANLCLTLCHQVDVLMTKYLKLKEQQFVAEGGIRERMTAARLGYRNSQREALSAAQAEVAALQEENTVLKARIRQLEEALENHRNS